MADPRRSIAHTDAALADDRLAAALAVHGRDSVKRAVTRAQQRARDGEIEPGAVVEHAARALQGNFSSLRPVLNATGVLVHTNLGRAPLSAAAVAAIRDAAGYTDVEFDVVTGVRARRGRGALAALASAVPAAESVYVVNNTAAALLLSAMVLAAGREIIVSRGELVEIGDGFRIPELLASTGARLREVGTTNRTHLRDYAAAVSTETGFVLKVHTSNFSVVGFTAGVELPELASLGVPVVADLGSGLLRPHPLLPNEPDATTALKHGADLVLASGDKLLGGPQAGLMLGRSAMIERLRRHPAARALRVDKLTLAALEATLLGPTSPIEQGLRAPLSQVWERAQSLAERLCAAGVDARAVKSAAAVGGGGAPGFELASAAVSLPQSYAQALRRGEPPVIGRVEHGRCLLDLRAVPADADDLLGCAVRAVAN